MQIVSKEKIAERINAILSDPDPEMRHVDRHRILQRRVRVLLDGEDVTMRCRAFSIPTGRVELIVKENGKFLLDFTCGCSTVRALRQPYNYCPECCKEVTAAVATEVRHGRVEVIPLSEGSH